MHKSTHQYVLTLGCILSLTGCYNEPEDTYINNQSNITVTNIRLDTPLLPYQNPVGASKAEDEILPDTRFVICAYTQDGELQDRKVITLSNTRQLSYPVNTTFYLPYGKYRLTFWTDYVSGGSIRDWFYDTQDLREVLFKDPYVGNTDWKDAFSGFKDFDLTVPNSSPIKEDITLQRPLAKYRIIANDLEEYINKGGVDIADITADISYTSNTYNGFDAWEGQAIDQAPGHSFTGKTQVLSDSQLLLAWDYVWGNSEDTALKVNIVLRDKKGSIINSIPGIEFAYIRNKLSTVTGHFLTEEQDSGIGVITEYDGEFNVPLP